MSLNDEELDFSEMSDEEVAESLDDAMDAFGAAIGIETPWRILKEEYNSRPHAIIPNVSKIEQGKKLVQAVKAYAASTFSDVTVEAKPDTITLDLVVSFKDDGFCLKNRQRDLFNTVLSLCDSFEVNPIDDSIVEVSFIMYNFYIQN